MWVLIRRRIPKTMIKASSQEKEPNIGVILHQIKIANIARIFGDF